MSPVDDAYDQLGVPPEASDDEIRAAYRQRAALVHPDHQPPERRAAAQDDMRRLNEARDRLLRWRHSARRAAHDSVQRASTRAGEPNIWREQERARRRARQFRMMTLAVGTTLLFGLLCALPALLPQLTAAAGLRSVPLLNLIQAAISLYVPLFVGMLLALAVYYRNN
jgi:hypothetical protein